MSTDPMTAATSEAVTVKVGKLAEMKFLTHEARLCCAANGAFLGDGTRGKGSEIAGFFYGFLHCVFRSLIAISQAFPIWKDGFITHLPWFIAC